MRMDADREEPCRRHSLQWEEGGHDSKMWRTLVTLVGWSASWRCAACERAKKERMLQKKRVPVGFLPFLSRDVLHGLGLRCVCRCVRICFFWSLIWSQGIVKVWSTGGVWYEI